MNPEGLPRGSVLPCSLPKLPYVPMFPQIFLIFFPCLTNLPTTFSNHLHPPLKENFFTFNGIECQLSKVKIIASQQLHSLKLRGWGEPLYIVRGHALAISQVVADLSKALAFCFEVVIWLLMPTPPISNNTYHGSMGKCSTDYLVSVPSTKW